MATKLFAKALMASEDVKSYLCSVKFTKDGEYAEIHDGAVVVLGDAEDYNVYKAAAPTAVTDKVVLVDIADVERYAHAGNTVKMGNKQFDLVGTAGEAVRARRPQIGDKFWVGEGNFTAAPTVGQYAVVTANDTVYTPSATVGNGFAVKVNFSADLTLGQSVARASDRYEQKYLCEVVAL